MASSRKTAAPIARNRATPELARCFEETVALYFQLTASAKRIYRKGDLSGPRRTVLVALARSGPRTVAHLARTRLESRQRFQPLVHALVGQKLLRYVENPLHKRSPLVMLTEKGEATVRAIEEGEATLRAQLPLDIPARDLEAAADVLHRIRKALEDPATKRLLDQHGRRAPRR
jgi:DNA-binding MarR family transcriptional regulator